MALGLMGASIMLCEQSLRPPRRNDAPLPGGWEPASLRGAGDVPLYAAYHPAAAPCSCVLILHGVGDNHRGPLPLGNSLAQSGFRVLVPDSRAHGRSGGDLVTFGLLEREDVARWSDWLRRQGCAQGLYAYGASMGAAILLQSLAEGAPIDAAAAESPFASFRRIAVERIVQTTPAPEWLARPMVALAFLYARARYGLDFDRAAPDGASIRKPVLLIHGLEDRNIPPGHSRDLSRSIAGSRLWLVPGAGHIQARSFAGAEFDRRLREWFEPGRASSARTERAYGNPQTRQ